MARGESLQPCTHKATEWGGDTDVETSVGGTEGWLVAEWGNLGSHGSWKPEPPPGRRGSLRVGTLVRAGCRETLVGFTKQELSTIIQPLFISKCYAKGVLLPIHLPLLVVSPPVLVCCHWGYFIAAVLGTRPCCSLAVTSWLHPALQVAGLWLLHLTALSFRG